MAVYRGHMLDRLTGTSNGGATVHAFGYKVTGPGSFGQDGGGEEARPINGGRDGHVAGKDLLPHLTTGRLRDGDGGETDPKCGAVPAVHFNRTL